MKTIWKYPLSIGAAQTILSMPTGAEVVRFSMQNDEPHVWALVDHEKPRVSRTLQIVGTGRSVPERSMYLGTCDQGVFVWHLFELLA